MKCSQCERPAFYKIFDQKVPLCLHCYSIWHETQNIDFLKSAMMMNMASDHIDMVTGIPSLGGRMPTHELARAIQRSPTLNNFVISESQIGVLNTGSIQRIDAAITLSKGSDTEIISQEIKALVEAVMSSEEIDDTEKNEVIELTESLAEQVVGQRKTAPIIALMNAIKEKVSGALVLSSAAEKLWNVIKDVFN